MNLVIRSLFVLHIFIQQDQKIKEPTRAKFTVTGREHSETKQQAKTILLSLKTSAEALSRLI